MLGKGFVYLLLLMVIVDFRRLFANTKPCKNGIQQVVVIYLTCDLSEVLNGAS